MNLLRKSIMAAALVFGLSGTSRADITIDDFGAPNPGITYLINFSDPNPSVFVTPNIGPGINRTVTLTVTTPNPPVVNSMGGEIGGPAGIFSMSLNNSSSGNAVINYSFSSAINFVPTGTPGSLRYLSTADAGFGTNVPLNFVITTASGDLSFNTFMNLTGTFTPTDVPLANFTGTGDLTQVTGMSVTILGGQAADVALDMLTVTTPQVDPIPAPPAALLALLALPALGFRRRGQKNDPAMA